MRNWDLYRKAQDVGKRLLLLSNCKIRYEFKAPFRDCSASVVFEQFDFIAKLVTLVRSSGST